MSYQVIGAKRKCKYYKLPFLTTNDDHVKKIQFTNYDRYDRREALKNFLDVSYVRYKLDADEDMEFIESDPTLINSFVAGQNSYGRRYQSTDNSNGYRYQRSKRPLPQNLDGKS